MCSGAPRLAPTAGGRELVKSSKSTDIQRLPRHTAPDSDGFGIVGSHEKFSMPMTPMSMHASLRPHKRCAAGTPPSVTGWTVSTPTCLCPRREHARPHNDRSKTTSRPQVDERDLRPAQLIEASAQPTSVINRIVNILHRWVGVSPSANLARDPNQTLTSSCHFSILPWAMGCPRACAGPTIRHSFQIHQFSTLGVAGMIWLFHRTLPRGTQYGTVCALWRMQTVDCSPPSRQFGDRRTRPFSTYDYLRLFSTTSWCLPPAVSPGCRLARPDANREQLGPLTPVRPHG